MLNYVIIEPKVIQYLKSGGGGAIFQGFQKSYATGWYSKNRDQQHTLKKKITKLKLGVYHHATPFKEDHLKKKCQK